jgi:hypothetical protein
MSLICKNKIKASNQLKKNKKMTPLSYCEHKKKNNAMMEEHT